MTKNTHRVVIEATIAGIAFHGSKEECDIIADDMLGKPFSVAPSILLDECRVSSVMVEEVK